MKPRTTLLSVRLITTLIVCHQLEAFAGDAAIELLVKWKDGPNSPAAAIGNAQIGSTIRRNFNALGWQLVELPAGLTASDGMRAYRALDTVADVESGGDVSLDPLTIGTIQQTLTTVSAQALRTPNDPLYPQQWNWPRISAPTAWGATTGSSNVVVAIIDTGVDYTHPELARNMWRNPGETGLDAQSRDKATNGIDDDGNGYVDDVHGIDVWNGSGNPMDEGFWNPPSIPATNHLYHGTFIAGLIGGVSDNRLGIAGLNWSVQLMAIRATGGDYSDSATFSPTLEWVRILAAWDYVLMMKRRGVNIRVANNSYAYYVASAAIRDAMVAAGNEGILSVCSAGNYRYDEDLFSGFPRTANIPSVLSVAASTESDTLVDIANFWGSNFGRSTVHLAAPGVNLVSTWKGGLYYFGLSGTSFAAPQVAGAAALLLSVNPNLTVTELKAALFGSVDQPASLRGKLITSGRLNVARTLEYLTNSNPPAIVITALPAGQRTATNAPIQVTFNRPMNRVGVESAFTIMPPVNGTFVWSDDSRSFLFQHDAPLDSTTNYTVRILGTAQDESAGTLDGNFNRTREGSPADDFVWTFRFVIPNDDFAQAQWLAGSSASIQSSNRYASTEMFEPDHAGDHTSASSVWYRWTPPSEGWFTFDLNGTTFDSLLAAYVGDTLDRLLAVATNDNYGTRTNSRVSFMAFAGTNYSIAVATKSSDVNKRIIATNQSGPFTLNWYPTPAPSFTGTQFTPSSGAPGTTVTLFGTNFTGATSVVFNGASASFTNAFTNDLDLRSTAIIPPDAISGPITIVTPHGSMTSAASFQMLPPPLIIRLTAANALEITWPATSSEFVLEEAENLSTGVWTPLTELPVRANGQSKLTLTAPTGNHFYRLKKN